MQPHSVSAATTHRLAQLLQQRRVLARDAAAKPPPDAGRQELKSLLQAEVEQLVKVNATVRKLLEGALLLHLLDLHKGGSVTKVESRAGRSGDLLHCHKPARG